MAGAECIRKIVLERLLSSDLEITRLPLTTPADKPHVPILTSANLGTCKRCIVYIGEPDKDLGILAGRLIDHENFSTGSVLNLVNAVRKYDPHGEVGIIIANPGQLLWYRRGRKALTRLSWEAIPRPYAVSATLPFTSKNYIPRNSNVAEHVACVFEDVIAPLRARECKVHVIAAGYAAVDAVDYLQKEWNHWESCVETVSVSSGHVWQTELYDDKFKDFWCKVSSVPRTFMNLGVSVTDLESQRGRAYLLSEHWQGTPMTGREHFGCNVFASGEHCWTECIMPRAYHAIVDYISLVARHPHYVNMPPEEDETKEAEVVFEEPKWDDDEDEQAAGNAGMAENPGVDEGALTRAMDAVKVSKADGKGEESKREEE